MPNNFAPIAKVNASSIEIGSKTLFSNLISVLDLDGNEILKYRVRDNGSVNYSAFLTKSSVRLNAGQWYEFNASELASVYFNAALIASGESISVQAYDGRWSSVASGIITTINGNFFAPVIETIDGSVLADEFATITELFTASDRDGDPIVQYRIADRSPSANSGYFTLNGVAMPQGQWMNVQPADISKLRYVSAAFGTQTEMVSIMATDGKYFSDVYSLTMTTTPNSNAPTVSAFAGSGRLSSETAISHFFNASDLDGNTIKNLKLRDTGTNPLSGRFHVNGVAQTQGEWFTVPYRDLDSITYKYGAQGETETFEVQVYDGRYWSTVKEGLVSSIPVPVFNADKKDVIIDTLEKKNLSSFFSQTDSGPAFERYQVIDVTSGPKTAKITLNSNPLAEDIVYTFNATQYNSLLVEGGLADAGRGYDDLKVRAFNGIYWTPWEEVNVLTEPNYEFGIYSGQKWNGVVGNKTVVTYTFIDGTPVNGPYPPLPTYYAIDSDEANGVIALSADQRTAIRNILADIEGYANLDFVEVPYEFSASQATITFGGNDQSPVGSQGWAYLPLGNGRGSTPGDVWFHNDPADDTNITNVANPDNDTPGMYGILTYVHEIGHALGFDHSFSHNYALPVSIDSHDNTVMSYTNSPVRPNDYPITFMYYDVLNIQSIYGANTDFRTGNDQYSFANDDVYRQIVWDGGGIDTISYFNQIPGASIDLREGKWSSLNGVSNALIIAKDAVIENARGTRSNDTIHGNGYRNLIWGYAGDDRITGDGGNDLLRGMEGSDTYVWETGDGLDRIDEERLGGRDVIEIHDVTGDLDALENDFSFTRVGAGLRDLRIDLTMNRGQSHGSMIVTNEAWGASRVETLRFFDAAGEQIGNDVDLTSVYAGSTNTKQQFKLTDFETTFGFIAVPV